MRGPEGRVGENCSDCNPLCQLLLGCSWLWKVYIPSLLLIIAEKNLLGQIMSSFLLSEVSNGAVTFRLPVTFSWQPLLEISHTKSACKNIEVARGPRIK